MMCNACRQLSKVWDYGQRLLVSRFDDAKTGEPTFILTQENREGVAQSVVIKVRFCPWCGAKMRREEMQGFTREEYVAYENELKRYSTPTGINVFDDFPEMDGKEQANA